MTPIEFDADLRREGYQVMNSSLAPNQLNPDHTHEFDARIMVLPHELLDKMGSVVSFRYSSEDEE